MDATSQRSSMSSEENGTNPMAAHHHMDAPVNDTRQYRAITLPNGLRGLLVHDDSDDLDQAACAVAVHVGQLQDSMPGLAHLLEHLLFMGSAAFPPENALDSHLSQAGGYSNAYTDLDVTNYYFECHKSALYGALQRFGSCFVQPLLLESSIAREIQAIDSEHAKNVAQDHWKCHQLSRSVLGGSVMVDGSTDVPTNMHPYAQFGSGSQASLLPPHTDAAPRIAQLQHAVRVFWQQYYVAPNMTVAILGAEPLDTLETWIRECFGNVPTPPPSDHSMILPGTRPLTPALPQRVHWVPCTPDSKTLELSWPLREIHTLYRSKPTHVLSHLLGHEGPGSLLQVLRQRGWAHELGADGVSRATRSFAVLAISIELTAAGWEHVDDIVELVYAYIAMLQQHGIPDWVVDELQDVGALTFRYLGQHGAADTVSALVAQLQLYPELQYVLSGPFIYLERAPQMLREILDCLTVDNMLVMVAHEAYQESADRQDEHYGTLYSLAPLSVETASKWQSPASNAAAYGLHLPDKNDMLATQFDLVPTLAAFADDKRGPPRCILDTETCRVWYKPDTVFSMPKANVLILLRTCVSYASPTATVLAALYTEGLQELSTSAFSYAASMAGLHCSFNNTRRGIEIHVGGFSHKVDVLLGRIVDVMQKFAEQLDDETFVRVQDKVQQQYWSFFTADPYQHAIIAVDYCMESPKWSMQSCLECLPTLTRNDLMVFAQQLLARFRAEMLVHGNLTAEQALGIAKIVTEGFKPERPLDLPTLRAVQVPTGRTATWRFASWNEHDANSCAVNVYQVGSVDLRDNAKLSVLNHLIREPAFNQLRTNEQLGYIVHSQVKTSADHIKSLLLLVQSDTFDPEHVNKRIEVFLLQFRAQLETMPEETFASNVESVCQSLLEKKKNLGEESMAHWNAMTNETYHFTRHKDIAKEAATLVKVDVLRFYDRHFHPDSPHRRKLGVQIYGKNHQTELADLQARLSNEEGAIDNAQDFVRGQYLYPAQKVALFDVLLLS